MGEEKSQERAQKIEEYSQNISDAKGTLKKYKDMLREIASATKTLIAASVKRGLTSRIDKIQKAYEEKKKAITDRIEEGKKEVSRYGKAQKGNIERTQKSVEKYDSKMVETSEEHSPLRGAVARTIRGVNKARTARYKAVATIGGKTLLTVARAAAQLGMKKTAGKVGLASSKYVDRKMTEASEKATAKRSAFRARSTAHDKAAKDSDKIKETAEKEDLAEKETNTKWAEQKGTGKITRRTISGIAKGISTMARFTARTRTNIYELAAQVAAAFGKPVVSKTIMEKAKEKAARTMDRAGRFNAGMRAGADAGIEAGESMRKAAKTVGSKGRAIGKHTIDFSRGAVTGAGRLISEKAQATRDNVSLRYQKSKQGLLTLVRNGAKTVVGRMDESLEVSKAAASKTQTRISERNESKKEDAGQEK